MHGAGCLPPAAGKLEQVDRMRIQRNRRLARRGINVRSYVSIRLGAVEQSEDSTGIQTKPVDEKRESIPLLPFTVNHLSLRSAHRSVTH